MSGLIKVIPKLTLELQDGYAERRSSWEPVAILAFEPFVASVASVASVTTRLRLFCKP